MRPVGNVMGGCAAGGRWSRHDRGKASDPDTRQVGEVAGTLGRAPRPRGGRGRGRPGDGTAGEPGAVAHPEEAKGTPSGRLGRGFSTGRSGLEGGSGAAGPSGGTRPASRAASRSPRASTPPPRTPVAARPTPAAAVGGLPRAAAWAGWRRCRSPRWSLLRRASGTCRRTGRRWGCRGRLRGKGRGLLARASAEKEKE